MAGAVAMIGLGVGAAGASAYSISGGSYVGTLTTNPTWTIGGAYTIDCPAADVTFSGDATGADTTSFTPAYGVNCNYWGLPANVAQSGTWSLRVIGGPDVAGWYVGEVAIPAGSSTTISIPLAGCTQTVSGPQTYTHGAGGNVIRFRNVTGGVQLEASVNTIAYSASGCPFPSGTDGTYNSNGAVDIPGITVS